MPTITIDGVSEINYVRTGPRGGRPIVFVHGVGLDLTWWSAQVEEFGRDYDIIAVDMPGHGLSANLRIPPSFELMATVLSGLITHIDAGPVHLVGISFGGMVAQTLALGHPDLICSLSLVATLCTFPDLVRDALRQRASVARSEGMAKIAQLSNERWFTSEFRERRPDMLDRATNSLLRQNADYHASIWEMIAELDLEERISVITCPTLIIVGAEDVNAPIAAGYKIADRIVGADLHEMAGLGHFPPFEAPAAFNVLLRNFLKREDVAGA